jgi:hypothetical protein
MVKVNLNIKMVIIFKEIILKIKKEEKENIILAKEEFYNHNLIPIHHKYPKSIYQMVQFISVNKRMVLVKVLVELLTLMVVIMMDSG